MTVLNVTGSDGRLFYSGLSLVTTAQLTARTMHIYGLQKFAIRPESGAFLVTVLSVPDQMGYLVNIVHKRAKIDEDCATKASRGVIYSVPRKLAYCKMFTTTDY